MAWYEKEWWKKLVGAKPRREHIDSVKDIEAILEFLEEVHDEIRELVPLFEKLEELEKEQKVGTNKIIHVNLEAQADILDKILEKYEFFQNDVDINGLRVKTIAKKFLDNAEKNGLKDLVKEKREDQKWWMMW